jgi:hypothetical protein
VYSIPCGFRLMKCKSAKQLNPMSWPTLYAESKKMGARSLMEALLNAGFRSLRCVQFIRSQGEREKNIWAS